MPVFKEYLMIVDVHRPSILLSRSLGTSIPIAILDSGWQTNYLLVYIYCIGGYCIDLITVICI